MRAWKLWWVASVVGGCTHNADSLSPRVEEDLGRWLPYISQPSCQECVLGKCRDFAQTCLDDGECKHSVASCVPPNPGCAQSSVPARNFNVCVASGCLDPCELGQYALTCVGKYSWAVPLRGKLAFDFQLNNFNETNFAGQAEVTPCSGGTPTCDTEQTVYATTSAPVAMSYDWNMAAARVYFRVTGPDIVPLYFYEDAQLTPHYLINVPAVADFLYFSLLDNLGAQYDLEHGSLSVATFDCVGTRFPGVELRVRDATSGAVDANAIAYAFDGSNLPRANAGAPVTLAQGQAGYVNLTPGVYDIDGYIGETRVASIPSVTVQGGALTHVNLFPLAKREVE